MLDRRIHRQVQDLSDVPPAQGELEHLGLESLALALVARCRHTAHERHVRIDDSGAVAHRACTFGIRAEQGGLDPVGLRERLPNGFENPRVRRRVAAP